jgi:hypothetical protein
MSNNSGAEAECCANCFVAEEVDQVKLLEECDAVIIVRRSIESSTMKSVKNG